jgi:hypothetical protein
VATAESSRQAVLGLDDDEFSLFGFSEFVRLGDGFCADAPLELEAEELTNIGGRGGRGGAEESRELVACDARRTVVAGAVADAELVGFDG